MGCLTVKEALIDVAKAAAAPLYAQYEADLATLRSILPGSYETKEDWEAARNAAILDTVTSTEAYQTALAVVNTINSTIVGIKGWVFDLQALTIQNGSLALLNQLLALPIPGIEAIEIPVRAAMATAVTVQQTMQCAAP